MEIIALSNSDSTRNGEKEGHEGKKKPGDDILVTRPHHAWEHTVHWDLCPHLGWNVVYSISVIHKHSLSHKHGVQQDCCNPSVEAFERFLLRHNWIRCGRCASTGKEASYQPMLHFSAVK